MPKCAASRSTRSHSATAFLLLAGTGHYRGDWPGHSPREEAAKTGTVDNVRAITVITSTQSVGIVALRNTGKQLHGACKHD